MISSLKKGAIGLALLCVGVLAGGALPSMRAAHGEIRTGPPPESFQSGGQLSVPVLKEIASTLRQMDSRLARLEAVAQKMQAARTEAARTDAPLPATPRPAAPLKD